MRRTLIGIALATSLITGLAAPAAIAAQDQVATASATNCHLSSREQRNLGASYVTSLKVSGTTCAKGKGVTLAFHNCRLDSGKPQGLCDHKVGHYTCTEHRYDAVPHIQYSSKVTCTWGDKKVFSTYTQNT